MKVNYHVLNDSIVLNYDGKTHVVPEGDSRYNQVLDAIRAGTLELIPEIVEIEKTLSIPGFTLRDGLLYDGETALPDSLSSRILKLRDLKLPFEPLAKFWENLKQNPSFNSRTQLFKFLEHNGHPLTEAGEFIAYRGVREDFKDKHTGTFDNSPGQVLEMARENVDDNPNNTCSNGFHVACFDYAKSFGSKLVEVKVNPRDVVAVPNDYAGTKMRVSRFEVVQEVESMNNQEVYGHGSRDVQEDTVTLADYDLPDEDESDQEDGVCPSCGESDQWGNYCSECGEDLDN